MTTSVGPSGIHHGTLAGWRRKKLSLKPNCKNDHIHTTKRVSSSQVLFRSPALRFASLPAILLEKITHIKDKDAILNIFLHVVEPSCIVHRRKKSKNLGLA